MLHYLFSFLIQNLRRDGDSNPGYPLGVYTLSRRASSTTRASLQGSPSVKKRPIPMFFGRYNRFFSYKCILFFGLMNHSGNLILQKTPKLINFKTFAFLFEHSKHF